MNRSLITFFLLFGFISALVGHGQGQIIPRVQELLSSNQLGDPKQPGRFIALEVIATYGSWVDDIQQQIADVTGTLIRDGELIAPNMWVRLTDRKREVGDEVFIPGSAFTEFGVASENGALRWSERHQNWQSQSSSVTLIGGRISIHDFKRWNHYRDRRHAGRTQRRYGIYIEDSDANELPESNLTTKDVLRHLVAVFEETGDAALALMILDLSRFFPLNSVLDGDHTKQVLLKARRIASSHWMRLKFGRRSRHGVPVAHYYEQAMLRAGIIETLDPLNELKRDDRNDCLTVFHFLAESKAVSGPCRTFSFQRCMNVPKGTHFHENWISMLKSGELPMPVEVRDSTIERLQVDIASRSPSALAALCCGLLGTFALSILFLRFLSRRLMFPS